MRTLLIVAVAGALIALSGCTHGELDPTAAPHVGIPTFDADQAWRGADSPVLGWTDLQRDAFLETFAQATRDALAQAGLDSSPPPDATAVDTMRRAEAVGSAVPRPARELMLLATLDDLTGDATDEAMLLDAAWTACTSLATGTAYEDLVYAAGSTFDAETATAQDRAILAASLYAPIVCYENADEALDAIAGIDGPEVLE